MSKVSVSSITEAPDLVEVKAEGSHVLISARERQVLTLAGEGLTDKEISSRLGVGIRTIGTYWERLRTKTQGRSRTHMVMLVMAQDLKAAVHTIEAQKILLSRLQEDLKRLQNHHLDCQASSSELRLSRN